MVQSEHPDFWIVLLMSVREDVLLHRGRLLSDFGKL